MGSLIGSEGRRSTPDEHVGTQIGAVAPHYGSALGVDFQESPWVLEQFFEDSPAHERTESDRSRPSGRLSAWPRVVRAAEVLRISKEALLERVGDSDVILLDVRQAPDWSISRVKIRDGIREDPRDVAAWVDKYPKEKTLVPHCA